MTVPEFPPFAGFPAGTTKFLGGLTKHNDRAWFAAHRADADAFYLAPAQSFVAALGPKLQRISASVRFDPRVNGSIGRIYRDTRFAKDKTPYKDHLDLMFWHGERKGWSHPVFWFRLRADRVMLGVGMYHFEPPQLAAYRAAVIDPVKGKALAAAIAKVEKAGYQLGGDRRKKVPRGFDADHPRAAFLLHDGLTAMLEVPLPTELREPKFVDWCAAHYRAQWPIGAWLLKTVAGAE